MLFWFGLYGCLMLYVLFHGVFLFQPAEWWFVSECIILIILRQRDKCVTIPRNKKSLPILDNPDEIPDQSNLIHSLINLCPRVKSVITTSMYLDIRGEKVIYFSGLQYPAGYQSPGTQEEIDAPDMQALTSSRARADLALERSNLLHVMKICKILMGLPLGIGAATSYARLFIL